MQGCEKLANGTSAANTSLNSNRFKKMSMEHPLWNNPLLLACQRGQLQIEQLKFIFSQYYLYSKNFSKLIAVAMSKSDDKNRHLNLSKTIWDKEGVNAAAKRHITMFKNFLENVLLC